MKPVLYRYKDTESVIKVMDGYTPGDGWEPLYSHDQVDQLQAQLVRQQKSYEAEIKVEIDSALERAAAVRTKLPPAKYGENASAPQQIYQDAFDRGWQAGISAMRGAIRALKEQQ